MRLLFKNISLTKKVEFTLSSKIIQAACLFLFSGSVSKLSFDRIIIDETCQFCFKTHRRTINFFVFIIFISHITSKLFFWMQICPPEKTNISFQLNAPLRREKKPTRKVFNISEILESIKLYQHVTELST